MTRKLSTFASGVAAALVLAVSAADASTVYIGLQQDGNPNPPVTVASNAGGLALFSGPFGNFETVTAFAFGEPAVIPPLLLQAGAGVSNTTGGDAGTLKIFMTSTGNTSPLGAVNFTSGFATVDLTPGWTEILQTYVDPGNGIYALTTLLGQAVFNTVDSEVDQKIVNIGAGPYSVTTVLTIVAPSNGGATKSVGLNGEAAPIPEPASLAALGAALAGLGIVYRRRRKVD